MSKNGRYLSTKEVAALWHVSPPAVAKWIREKRLKAFTTPGGHYRIAEAELFRFAELTGAPLPGLGRADSEVRTWRVLIVDDDPILLEFMEDALGAAPESFDIRTANNGYDAGSIVSTWEPELLIIDLLMPGMNGFEVCGKLAAAAASGSWAPQILAVTGFGSEDNLARALASGAHDCLTKPFTFSELLRRVRQLLGVAEAPGTSGETCERRRWDRQNLCVPITLLLPASGAVIAKGHTVDVSQGGIKAKISDFTADGGNFRAAIKLIQFGQPVEPEVTCCWTLPHQFGENALFLGLRLDGATQEQCNLLKAAALFERSRQNLALPSLRS